MDSISTLAIETSCDDTSVGIVRFDGQTFRADTLLAYSQIQEHQRFGGVVPELAYRLHSEKIIGILEAIGKPALEAVDCISVTTHPGLPGSLLVGKTVGNMLAWWLGKPLVEVNHIHGHLMSIFLERNIQEIEFPMVALTASGGHNDLYLLTQNKGACSLVLGEQVSIQRIGTTLDDAAGECFDKVSRMLGGPYPGGKRIGEQALLGGPNEAVRFKRIRLKADEFNFSFSGMKAQVHQLLTNQKSKIKNQKSDNSPLEARDSQLVRDVAYEFQEAVVEVLAKKLLRAGAHYGAKSLAIVGWVSANDRLIEYIQDQKSKIKDQTPLFVPVKKVYCMDNAAMIGVAGIVKHEALNMKH